MKRQRSDASSKEAPRAKRQPPSDSVDDDDDDDDNDDDVMDLSQNPDIHKDTKEAECGIIEKISLKNFMCHNRLDISLGPNINFIVGNNGSGKSAVVTAIVVGLGGKASTTNRGSKLKGFVKTGKQTANVEIKIRNRGADAFRPELYGDSITVCRKFNVDGSSGYRLLSKSGKVVSLKKDDLIRMLDQFNIQVDNPLAVLNQDTSKNFLNSKSSHDKYKFFLKATQLEQIKEDYSVAQHHKDETREIINSKVQTLPKLEKEVLDWEQKYKSMTAIKDLEEKVVKLKQELAWSFVLEKEKGLHPLLKELSHEETTRLPKFKSKAEEAKTNLDRMNKKMEVLTSRLNSSGEEVKELHPAHQKAHAALNEQKKITRTAQMEVRRLEGALKNLKKEKQSIVERIQEIQTSSRHDYEEERQTRLKKINDLEERLSFLQAQETTTDHQLDQYRNAITKYKNDAYKLGQDQQVLKSQFEKQQRNLQALKASQGNRLKRFGPYMPQVIQTIDEYHRRGRFHHKPIGPLGACLTLTDQKWALAVESCLKGLIGSFCCHDFHDEKVLEEIMSNACPQNKKFSIIVSKFKDRVYNVSGKQADNQQFPTVLDVIQADNPMVSNTLIDQRTVECVLLIEDGKVARQVMDPDSRTPTPRNAREAFTIQGDQVFTAPTFRYYSSNQDKAKFLKANVEEDIVSLTTEINNLKQRLDRCRQQTAQIDTDIRKNKEEERRSETRLMKIREDKRKTTMELTDLKNYEDPAPVDVATYEEEVRILEEQISQQDLQIESKTTIYKEQETIQKTLLEQYKEIDEKLKSKIETGDSVKDEVGSVVNEIETCKANKKHFDTKLKEQEKKIKELKDRIEKYKADIETDIGKASSICNERINTRRSPKNLESELVQIDKQIKNEARRRGDPEEITRQYKEKKDAYMKIKFDVKQLERFLQKLDKILAKRFNSYKDFQCIMAVRARYFFITYLSNRNYKGMMKFDHKSHTLEMSVQPVQSSATEYSKDMMSLSGGERSFSTVCFILALWEAMECPFSCLDEFDVYMDMVNRRISMEMMMETAKTKVDRQFIFLSPQSMSHIGIQSTKLMRIFKMPSPERNQTTLDFPSTSDQ